MISLIHHIFTPPPINLFSLLSYSLTLGDTFNRPEPKADAYATHNWLLCLMQKSKLLISKYKYRDCSIVQNRDEDGLYCRQRAFNRIVDEFYKTKCLLWKYFKKGGVDCLNIYIYMGGGGGETQF